jgi:hypothetical protein
MKSEKKVAIDSRTRNIQNNFHGNSQQLKEHFRWPVYLGLCAAKRQRNHGWSYA